MKPLEFFKALRDVWLSQPALEGGDGSTAPLQGRMLGAADLLKPAALLLCLMLAVVGSALMVIYSAYEYRRLFNQHQGLSEQGDELQVEWGQLLLEESAWSSNNRVETLADKKLAMKVPQPENIEIVRHGQR